VIDYQSSHGPPRVCDDVSTPLSVMGVGIISLAGLGLVGGYSCTSTCSACRHPRADHEMARLCKELTASSSTKTLWQFGTFTIGHDKHRAYVVVRAATPPILDLVMAAQGPSGPMAAAGAQMLQNPTAAAVSSAAGAATRSRCKRDNPGFDQPLLGL
jgi:hypothetical protein